MVDDPSAHPDLFPTEKKQEKERKRLFKIIEELVRWENTNNEEVLQVARDEIWQSWRHACAANADHPRAKELFDRHTLPAFHDPFAGGGALPLEAQRLGLESYASDLNPVAVLINKAMIEIPPRFAGKPPVNPLVAEQGGLFERKWKGAQGLAEDVRYYGQWMKDEAEKRIGHLYPKVEVTAGMAEERPDLRPYVGEKLTVIAWLWARTVKSPNPAFAHVEVPLASSFLLSTKAGKQAYVQPEIDRNGYRFTVKVGVPPKSAKDGTKLGRGANFRCLLSDMPIEPSYIKGEGVAGRLGQRLMAVVAEGVRSRVYLSPTELHEVIACQAQPEWKPETPLPEDPRNFWTLNYGLNRFGDLFTDRQLVALTTFSALVGEVRERIESDAVGVGLVDDGRGLEQGGAGAAGYAEAVGLFLALAISRFSDRNNALCTWDSGPVGTKASTGGSARTASLRNLFARQAIPMAWDFGEANPFSDSGGGYNSALEWIEPAVKALSGAVPGHAQMADAQSQAVSAGKVVSSDPPYYDNIGYADLSDFFYVWLRRTLRPVFPGLFGTMAVPKADELVATPYRHGGKEHAEQFFLGGMTQAMRRVAEQAHPAYPVTIYYAFKQSESDGGDGTTNTGWDTFLAAVIEAGFAISGTWPMRTELANRMIGSGVNALASSIVLVCRSRHTDAPTATRREFVAALKAELPDALRHLQAGNIAPVDLAQAAIGPGMAVYTRFSRVLDAEGQPLTVRAALALINQVLDEALAEQEGDFDADSRWALAWFEQLGFDEGEFGLAEQLSKAKNTAVSGLVEAGIAVAAKGKVRLLKPSELPPNWDPVTDERLTVWEMVHQLVRVLEAYGEGAAATLVAKLGSQAETARELCYRLYTICERKRRTQEAISYNGLVQSWPEIQRLAQEIPVAEIATRPGELF